MIDKNRFEKRWSIEGKEFGLLKKPWVISKNNVRDSSSEIEIADIRSNLSPSLKEIGMQQIPVANGAGEVFIGGRRTVGWELNGEVALLVEIRDIPDVDQMAGSWGENYTKRDMDADQEGRLFLRMQEKFKLSSRKLSEKLGNIAHNSITRKIKVYKCSAAEQLGSIPHDTHNDSVKKLNYGKVIELLSLDTANRTKLIKEIKEKGMTRDEVRQVVRQATSVDELLISFPEEKREEIKEAVKDLLYTKDVKGHELIHALNIATESSQRTVAKKVAYDLYSNKEEADELYFVPRGGKCLGDKTEKYWHGFIDPVTAKEVNEASKEKNKGE